jgi:hypothetical protein
MCEIHVPLERGWASRPVIRERKKTGMEWARERSTDFPPRHPARCARA